MWIQPGGPRCGSCYGSPPVGALRGHLYCCYVDPADIVREPRVPRCHTEAEGGPELTRKSSSNKTIPEFQAFCTGTSTGGCRCILF